MKIAIAGAATDPNWGGGEPRVAKHLFKGLQDHGLEAVRLLNKRHYGQILSLAATPFGWDPAAVTIYRKRLELEKPDVVLGFYDYDASLFLATESLGIPFVCSVHIYWPVCPLGTLYIDGDGICAGPAFSKCLRHVGSGTPPTRLPLFDVGKFPAPIGAILYFKFRGTEMLLKRAARLVAPGNRMHNDLKSMGFHNVVTIRVGIPLEEIPVGDWTSSPKIVILNSGSPIERKGIGEFRRLAAVLKARWPDVIFRATNYPGDAYIAPTPYLSRSDLISLLESSYVSVLPTLWKEPFPAAALEAMAAGKPVVTYDTGGLPEIVQDGVTGIVVPRGDIRAFTDAVESLLRDEATARRMGNAGRKRVESEFSCERMISAYARLLREVAGKPRSDGCIPAVAGDPP